jgi:ribosomal protein S18 acetylase RimI-like enzyme
MILIRDCADADFNQVFVLLEELWPDKALDAEATHLVYDRALACDLQRYLCAVDDANVVGFCSLTIKNNLWQAGYLGHIDELIVSEQMRGRGIGRALLAAVIEIAIKANCSRVELDSALHRSETHDFYQRQGFENRAYLFSKAL